MELEVMWRNRREDNVGEKGGRGKVVVAGEEWGIIKVQIELSSIGR